MSIEERNEIVEELKVAISNCDCREDYDSAGELEAFLEWFNERFK